MPAGSSMSWVDNGVAECAYIIESGRNTDSARCKTSPRSSAPPRADLGSGSTVVSYTTPLAGVYHCSATALGSQYVAVTYSGAQVDCTITVTPRAHQAAPTPRDRSSATFAATGSTSVTTTVTSGLFDTVVTAVDD